MIRLSQIAADSYRSLCLPARDHIAPIARLAAFGLVAMVVFGMQTDWAVAQVVQLPAVSNFSYSGSVSVPDGGTAALGGTGYSAGGSRSAGGFVPSNRASSVGTTASGASVSATIIDLQSMDAALLAEAEQRRVQAPTRYSPKPTGDPIISTTHESRSDDLGLRPLARPWGRDPFGSDIDSSRTIPPDYAGGSGAVHDEQEIRHFMERAQQAQSLGRFASAEVYYRMALSRMTPAQRERLAAKAAQTAELAAAMPGSAAGVAAKNAATDGKPATPAATRTGGVGF